MSIRSMIHAFMVFSLLAPAVARAEGGVIRFAGAVVEPANCIPRVSNADRGLPPRVSCAPGARDLASEPGVRVRTHVRELASDKGRVRSAEPRRYLVTLEYL